LIQLLHGIEEAQGRNTKGRHGCSSLKSRGTHRAMNTPERTGAAQRPNHPATSGAPRRKQPEPVAHVRYVMRGLRSTAIAFMAPTIVAPLLPAPVKPLRLIVSGLLYADQQLQPSDMRFNPPPGRQGQCAGMLLGLLPFIPAFALQGHLTETWCTREGSVGTRIAATSQRAWTGFWNHFPKRVAEVAARYPINFVLARCVAQVAASIVGSSLSAGYHRTRGRKLVARKLPPVKPRLPQRIAARPEVYAAGGMLFLVPALLDSRTGLELLQKVGVPRASIGTVITSSLVGAALTTSMVTPERKA
jgi:hypothetical protein